MEKLKICIFSDIHYIKNKPNFEVNQKLTEYAEELVDMMIDKINNEIKPDICINLGDLIQASSSFEEDKENLQYIWKKLQQIRVPFYTLIGNHELKQVKSNKEVLDIIGYESATFSLDVNNYHLIFCGTEVNNVDTRFKTHYLSDMDMEFIKDDLKNNINKKIIVFTHFGIAEDDMKGNFWFENNIEAGMLQNRKQLKDLLNNSNNILAVFSAHQHWTKRIKEYGIDYYLVGSLVENINHDGIPDGVYFDVQIDDNDVCVLEKHLKIK